MKKIVALVSLLTAVTVFFVFNVSAAVVEPTLGNVIIHEYPSGNTTERVVSVQLLPSTANVEPGITTMSEVCTLVSISIINGTDYHKFVPFPSFQIYLNRPDTLPVIFTEMTHMDRVSGELTLEFNSTTKWYYAKADNGYACDNGFVVPAHTTFNCVYALWFPASTTSGQSWNYATLDDFRAMYYQNVVNTGELPAGSPANLTIDVDNIDDTLTDILAYIGGQYGFPYVSSLLSTINTSISNGVTQIDTDLDDANSALDGIDTNTANIYNFLIGQYGFSRLATLLDITNTNTYLIYQQMLALNDKLAGDSTTNSNITTDSGTIKSQSDTMHQQETVWFTQNAQNIQATGLSNYHIGTVEGNGIASVTTDFNSLWNSLGGWTSVYVFSLTLGLALTILRHAPNAISRRIRKKQAE